MKIGGLRRPARYARKGRTVVYVLWRGFGIRFTWLSTWRGYLPQLPQWSKFDRAVKRMVPLEEDMPRAFGDGTPAASGAPVGVEKGSMAKSYPTLMGWIADPAYDDGKTLGKTALTLKRDGSHAQALLKIADQGGLKVEVRERTFERALAALEALLASEQCPWQHDDYPIGGIQKKKK